MIFRNKPWVPVVILIVAFAISVSVSAYEKAKFENWATTTGIVTHTSEIKHNRRRSLIFISDESVIYYDYSVNGKNYEGISSYMYINGDKYLEGESYQIWYNPDKPEESAFLNPYKSSVAYFPFIVAFISVFLYLIVFLGTKKKARK